MHGAFAGLDLRLAENGKTVAHRLDSGVGARAHAVGAHDEQEHAGEPEFGLRLDHIGPRGSDDSAEVSQVRDHGVADDERVREDKGQEYRHQGEDRFFDAAHVHGDKDEDAEKRECDLVRQPLSGKKTEERIGAAGDGNSNGEHVVDQKRRSRNHAGSRREQFACDEVAAAARGEELDDLGVARGYDEHRNAGHERDKNAQIHMAVNGQKRFFRTVTGRRQTVSPEADPGKECDQRQLVEKRRVLYVMLAAENDCLYFPQQGRFTRLVHEIYAPADIRRHSGCIFSMLQ